MRSNVIHVDFPKPEVYELLDVEPDPEDFEPSSQSRAAGIHPIVPFTLWVALSVVAPDLPDHWLRVGLAVTFIVTVIALWPRR